MEAAVDGDVFVVVDVAVGDAIGALPARIDRDRAVAERVGDRRDVAVVDRRARGIVLRWVDADEDRQSPNDANVPVMPLVAARLMPKTAMIEALPMIMPSMVRAERTRLRQSAAAASSR